MTPSRWEEIERIHNAALQRATGERAAFLAEACAEDAELRREVELLLAQDLTKPSPSDRRPGMGLSGTRARILR